MKSIFQKRMYNQTVFLDNRLCSESVERIQIRFQKLSQLGNIWAQFY